MEKSAAAYVVSPILLTALVAAVALSGGAYAYRLHQDSVTANSVPAVSATAHPNPSASAPLPVASPGSGISLQMLKEASYQYAGSTFTLKNGHLLRPVSASSNDGQEGFDSVDASFATGSLAAGNQDSAIVVNHGSGANRQVPIIFVFAQNAGKLEQLASLELADHARIDSAKISDGTLVLQVVAVGPNENYHSPSLHQTLSYQLSGNLLKPAPIQVGGTYRANGIGLTLPSDWTIQHQDSTGAIFISKATQQEIAGSPASKYSETPTADLYLTVSTAAPGKTLTEDVRAAGLSSNITGIQVGGVSAIAGTNAGIVSKYEIYIVHGGMLYELAFGQHDSGDQLTQGEHAILDSITFN